MKFLDNIRMRMKLIVLFLAVGLLPLLVAMPFAYWRTSDALRTQALDTLEAVEKLKKREIEAYFEERQGDTEVLAEIILALRQEAASSLDALQVSKSARLEDFFDQTRAELMALKDDPYTLQVMLEFEDVFHETGLKIDTPEWRALAAEHDQRFQDIAQDYGWHDVLLIAVDGDVAYTLRRGSDLGVNIPQSSLLDSGLGRAYQEAQTMDVGDIAVADFAPYAPSDGAYAAFMMAQMRDVTGTLRGYVAFQIPTEPVNAIVQDRSGLGQTGESYLVGKVGDSMSYRSDRVVKSGKLGEERSGGSLTYIEAALAGQSGIGVQAGSTGDLEMSAYRPLDLPGLDWAILTTEELSEVIVPVIEGQDEDLLADYVNSYGYDDLFLIDPDGYIFYSVKQEADYNTNILTGEYSDSNLARLIQQVLESKTYGIVDFEPYAPSANAYAAFIAQPILNAHGEVELVVALQLPHEHFNELMQEDTGMGEGGESYLIGRLNGVTAFRNDLLKVGGGQYAAGTEVPPAEFIELAFSGGNAGMTTGIEGDGILVAYEPLNLSGLDWAIVSREDRDEVVAPAVAQGMLLLGWTVGVAVVVTLAGVAFAASLADPIKMIAAGAQRLSKGDADLVGMDWVKIERINARGDELGDIGKAFAALIGYFKSGADAMQRIAEGDLSVDVDPQGEADLMGNAMVTMKQTIAAMAADVNHLIQAAVTGRLDVRADARKFRGEFFAIVQGVNETLDAVIGPLNMAAEYVDRISKGDIPKRITDEYQGDFNEIKINLNMCIDALNGLIAETDTLTRAAVDGRLDKRGDVAQFHGAYADLVRGINATLDAVIGPLNMAAEYVDRISKGDIPAPITDAYHGDFNEIKNNLNMCIGALNGLIDEVDTLTSAAVEGRLDKRGDVAQFQGAYAGIVGGMNATVDSLVGHINSLPAPAMIVDRDFTIRYVNQAAADIVGMAQQAAIGKKCYDCFKTHDCNTANCASVQAMSSGRSHTRETVANPGNRTLDIAYTGLALRDRQGVIIGAIETVVDQTEIRQMMQRIQSANDRLQSTVQDYVDYALAVGQGDLTRRLEVAGNGHKSDDPLIVLGRSLNEMTNNLETMISQIGEAVNNLASSSAEILAATTQQSSGASEQSAAITQATTTVDEVRTISEQAVMRAQEVADAAQRTVDVSRGGRRSVDETITSMGHIKERVERIAENILALSDQTQQIGEIISTVNDIASQSNMLALNASVEAARAGEHGKGFAVVAMEVRNLAEQSKQATSQVRAILTDIQNAINASVMVTEEGSTVVDEGVNRAAQARESIEQLSSVIMESAQIASQVVAGGQQQSSGVEQIAMAMQNINQAMVQSLASTRQAEKSARDLNDLAGALSITVQQYDTNGNGRGKK